MDKLKQLVSKHIIIKVSLFVILPLFLLNVATHQTPAQKVEPANAGSKVQSDTQKKELQPATPVNSKGVVEVKQVVETKPIAFTTTNKDDASLPRGQTKIVQEGQDGVETLTYSVTYTNGKETSRQLASQTTTTPAVEKIVAKGTYVAPAPPSTPTPQPAPTPAPSPVPSAPCNGYINVDGNCIASPSSNPAGATAQCNDGTYSYSQHHSGTCSGHGGVKQWL